MGDDYETRRRQALLRREGESEHDWAMRLVGEVESQYRYTLHWVGEYMRLGRLTDKLQRVISKMRRQRAERLSDGGGR